MTKNMDMENIYFLMVDFTRVIGKMEFNTEMVLKGMQKEMKEKAPGIMASL